MGLGPFAETNSLAEFCRRVVGGETPIEIKLGNQLG